MLILHILTMELEKKIDAILKDEIDVAHLLRKVGLKHTVEILGDHMTMYFIEKLYENNPKIELIDNWGDSLLIHASWYGYTEIAKILIENKANVNITNYKKQSPLQNAIQKLNIELVKLLLDNGADMKHEDENGHNALMLASTHPAFGKTMSNIIRLLIDNGANIDCQDKNGNTALMSTLWHSEVLIEKKANVNILNNKKQSALMLAVDRDDIKTVNLLLTNGANINHQDMFGNTALLRAIGNKYIEISILLIKNKADVNIRNNKKQSALHFALKHKNMDIIDLLFANNVNIDYVLNELNDDQEKPAAKEAEPANIHKKRRL